MHALQARSSDLALAGESRSSGITWSHFAPEQQRPDGHCSPGTAQGPVAFITPHLCLAQASPGSSWTWTLTSPTLSSWGYPSLFPLIPFPLLSVGHCKKKKKKNPTHLEFYICRALVLKNTNCGLNSVSVMGANLVPCSGAHILKPEPTQGTALNSWLFISSVSQEKTDVIHPCHGKHKSAEGKKCTTTKHQSGHHPEITTVHIWVSIFPIFTDHTHTQNTF